MYTGGGSVRRAGELVRAARSIKVGLELLKTMERNLAAGLSGGVTMTV